MFLGGFRHTRRGICGPHLPRAVSVVITDGGGGREAKVLEVFQAVGLVLRLYPGPTLFLLGHGGRSPPASTPIHTQS